LDDASRCSECVWGGFKCDVEGIPVRDWVTLEREEERIRSERQAAVQLMAITSARLARLEKQQEFLRKRGREMLRRGLDTLDQLDAEEQKEKDAAEAVEQAGKEAESEEQALVTAAAAGPSYDLFAPYSPGWWGFAGAADSSATTRGTEGC
jgi:hypothetical protein